MTAVPITITNSVVPFAMHLSMGAVWQNSVLLTFCLSGAH